MSNVQDKLNAQYAAMINAIRQLYDVQQSHNERELRQEIAWLLEEWEALLGHLEAMGASLK